MVVKTENKVYRGRLDSVKLGQIFIQNQAIELSDIKIIKFLPKSRLINGMILTASGPLSFSLGIMSFVHNFNSNSNQIKVPFPVIVGMLIYAPVGLIVGLSKFPKLPMNVDQGWKYRIIE